MRKRTRPGPRRRIAVVLAALSVTALALLGLQVPAQAAAAPPPTTSPTSAPTAPRTARAKTSAGTAATAAGAKTPAGKKTTSATKDAVTAGSNFQPACPTPGKDEFTCFALRRTDVKAAKGVQPATAAPTGYGADDLRSAYGLPADGGTGQTVAIVDAFDDPAAASDLAVYRAQYGLPACTAASGCFTKVDQRGGTDYPAADVHWSDEISLDLDMVSAVAPNARILLVEADSDGFDDLGASVNEAVALGARYVSNSYGARYDIGPGEDPGEAATLDPYYDHPGVAVVASAGDYGYGAAYPATSQYVTAVGGTSLTPAPGTARGWSESVWNNSHGGTGSGCSLYEPKPSFQKDTGCANRAETDVSAVADPETGVAVYQTYGDGTPGWSVYGGTSAAAPMIAATYADAGTPAAGTYPNSYPYTNASGALNDVTTGSNGTCDPAYLCTAGPGYDGPTGLGTPDGLAAFRYPPHGQVSGTVTARSGKPLAGATVTVGSASATTASDGTYTLSVPTGTYDAKATAYGYQDAAVASVDVTDGARVTEDFALRALPSRTISGTVTDGSGHGWPLYARISVDGKPGDPVWTNPVTGTYSLTLPQGHDYTLHIASAYPGYRTVTEAVTLGTDAQALDVKVPADPGAAATPGYTVSTKGSTETFDSTTAAPQGWSVVDAPGTDGGWAFDDPGDVGNHTGGSGAFAVADSDFYGPGAEQDSDLVSPVYDFTDSGSPEATFDTDYLAFPFQTAEVEATDDGGATWKRLWSVDNDLRGPATVALDLSAYANEPAVQLRFHFAGSWGNHWSVDDVFVGNRSVTPTPGGLVVGTVTDANTGTGLVEAAVDDVTLPARSTVTSGTPEDAHLGDGFYALFSPLGTISLTAKSDRHTPLTKTVKVTADTALRKNFTLQAGQLQITPGTVGTSAVLGAAPATTTLTVTDTGGAPATLDLSEQPGNVTAAADKGAPAQRVKGTFSPLAARPTGTASAAAKATATPAGASGTAWKPAPNLPVPVQDNAVDAYHGIVYSAFGATSAGTTGDLYALDPATQAWRKLAGAPDAKQDPAHGFIDGKFYAAGGWGATGSALSPGVDIYDPATDTWSTGAPEPDALGGAGTAVLDGKLYAVGGCTATLCGSTNVRAYDAGTDTWLRLAPYPEPVSWESCGGIGGKLYCAGGTVTGGNGEEVDSADAFVYDPAANAWSPVAGMPAPLWGSSYSSAGGLLLVSCGILNGDVTNEGYAYDPVAGSWTALPNANAAVYRGGGASGFYKVGGATGQGPVATSELLPGHADAGPSDVGWLGESSTRLTLQPGASATVTVSTDPAAVQQPGTYNALLTLDSDTPYALAAVPVSFDVTPPKNWGQISGTVSGLSADGTASPLAGATVEIDGATADYSLVTDASGHYTLWTATANNPLSVIVAKDGFRPTTATVRLTKGATVTRDFTLSPQ